MQKSLPGVFERVHTEAYPAKGAGPEGVGNPRTRRPGRSGRAEGPAPSSRLAAGHGHALREASAARGFKPHTRFELVVFLSQITDKTHVSKLFGIAWASVDAIGERVVKRKLPASRFDGLRRIGIDEVSYRRRHHYFTVVLDHDRKRVVWARQGRDLFRSRFALLKSPWNLNGVKRARLREVERSNALLYRGYFLKDGLARALDYFQPKRTEDALGNWLTWASQSRRRPFVRAARTIRRRFGGILAYVKTRATNAFTEGTNNRLRMIARRAYGYHDAQPLMSMLFLCCGGVELNPFLLTQP